MSNEKPTRKLMHTMRQAIRWGDMDVLGHVNNTVYFRYMESGRICFLEEAAGEFNMQGEGPVIVTAYCTFIIPLLDNERGEEDKRKRR
jgi:acyl-CoA thioester hydrolase